MKNIFFILSLVCVHYAFSYEVKDKDIFEKASDIKLIALDVDGVLTNGEIIYTSNGDEIKIFHAKDGFGLVLASEIGFITAIISGRQSEMVEKRSKELKISHLHQNVHDKEKILKELAFLHQLDFHEICYMGDDLPDLPALKKVGLSCCPSDAVSEVRKVSSWISSYEGGKGAVRELIDFLILSKK